MKPGGRLALALAITTLSVTPAHADAAFDQEALIVLRILAYDHNLATRSGKSIEIAVVERTGDGASTRQAGKVQGAFARLSGKVTVVGLPVHVAELDDGDGLAEELRARHINVVYVCRGLGDGVAAIARTASKGSALSFTDDPSYLDDGVAVALDRDGGKIQIDVNLVAAKAAGAQLGGQLLRLAKVVKR